MQRRARHIQPTDLKRKAIGAAVAELRRAAGFSQERLSADCGFERTYLSRVERGNLESDRDPRLDDRGRAESAVS